MKPISATAAIQLLEKGAIIIIRSYNFIKDQDHGLDLDGSLLEGTDASTYDIAYPENDYVEAEISVAECLNLVNQQKANLTLLVVQSPGCTPSLVISSSDTRRAQPYVLKVPSRSTH
jgi:hypothetical protein